ncbi:sulfite exporter TauE/SafE family protein [Solimonas sp. C16B3]|uniref:Probable membrane transporter protein n=2 Tax=Solimonas marina TaxID=2714601 RepID=A0A969WC17_9GAMM|nr:sulfite exporter TauE/SafE family protein [Solimonas marina]NKF23268.1 sulfite exporter TauE/SafE family protein [Solimonas marina]
MQELGLILAGLIVGSAVGATGVGGGSLMTPILILFCGIKPTIAVGTDLLYASLSKAFGVALHGRNGSVDWKIVMWLSAGSLPATAVTLLVLHHLRPGPSLDHLIQGVLAAAIIVTASFTLLQEPIRRWMGRHGVAVGDDALQRLQRPLTLLAGVLIGTLVTISSVGAGVIGMMILLLLYPRHEPVKLVGSDLAHAVLITGIAGLGHAGIGAVDYRMLGLLLVGALPGIWLGTRLGFRMSPLLLKRAVAGFLVFIGVTMAAKAWALAH